jgi:molecular chaperone HscA
MALLQISEPGQSPDPHQRRIAVGIDLGTTHSLVATVRHGVPECLPDEQGRVVLPSVVRYLAPGSGSGRQIGFDALAAQVTDPANTISSVKRLMGRKRADLAGVDRLPYTVLDRPGMAAVETVAGEKSPVEVSAEILATLRFRAEDSFDDELFGAVITVPAYFDDAQRQATKDAAQMAGLKVLRLINEPTAAAIAYGLDNGSEGVYAIYDLGGGTFDVSLLRLTRGVFEVLATGGDSALGGDDYDHALADWVLARNGLEAAACSPTERALLLREARRCKEALSALAEGAAELFQLDLAGRPLRQPVTGADFEQLTQALTQRTLAAARKVLRDAQVDKSEVQGVVMVGGSTRMPVVRRAVAAFFGTEPLTNLNPDEVVALGAAVQANQLAGNNPQGDLLLLDVIPLSLGI